MRLVLGVSGGIAAYKACELASRLVRDSHEVQVLMTAGAARFVAPLTFSALTHRPVGMATTDEPMGPLSHVALARWAQGVVIAPATANLLARLASGAADDLLTLVVLGFRGPVLLAPAMEAEMWSHPRTQANVQRLSGDGVRWVGPEFGRLASGSAGLGRMAEPEQIMRAWDWATTPQDLLGVRVLITAGPTWEHFDPVRILTNPATGSMGVLLAEEASRRGAEVVLVHGPRVTLPSGPSIRTRSAISARDMLTAVLEESGAADAVIGAAAVSDFRPAERLVAKAHKEDVAHEWAMAPNPDVLAEVGRRFAGRKVLVGFAAETDDAVASAQKKLMAKHLDLVVANEVGDSRGFGSDEHRAWMVTPAGTVSLAGGHKAATAKAVLDFVKEQVQIVRGGSRP
ncbi:MAG: bifunctional phosphopantothenoylcysteine decarboxylase/phosphopantothenate--cysteine ligase CoaBC [Thermaerobacter sp.]|nr:bifunctional phosphopantothenoylcysteine decarboxylase/phosphopantothenate--cysteine ligase CoaBC [Thermaerobacter sp.]